MSLNRNTGSALGFGIGIIIASVFFGTNWVMKNGGNVLKTQTLQNTTEPSATPTLEPIQEVVATPVAPAENPNDTIINRMAPSQTEVIDDIQKNLQELYGTNKNR